MSTTTTKFSYKSIPQFNPVFYRGWATDVVDAFAERNWSPYLVTPDAEASVEVKTSDEGETSTSTTTRPSELDPRIVIQAKAFLNQSIPYEYKAGLEECTTAAEIWLALQQRYASKSREDELRLEGQLLDFKKSATDSIDQHIAKFDILIASIIAQQPTGQRYDDTKKNRYFLRTLETAQIPNEDWKGFITFLGKSWLTITTHALFAEARTYYNTHIQPYIGQPTTLSTPTATATTTATDTDETKAFAIRQPDSDNRSSNFQQRGRGRGRSQYNNNSNNRNNYQNRNTDNSNSNRGNYNSRSNNRGSNNRGGFQRKLPTDPDAWCPYCRRQGHSYEQCYNKTRDPDYQQSQQAPNPSAPPQNPRVLTIRDLNLNPASPDKWLYDSCCAQHMSGNQSHFHTFDKFDPKVPIHGIGSATLFATGKGVVLLQDIANYTPHWTPATHRLENVWFVPGLSDSIISKHWTQSQGLKTSLDANENVILTSTIPGSTFKVTTASLDRLTVFPTLTCIPFHPRMQVLDIVTSQPIVRARPVKINSLLMHERCGHASSQRLQLIGIKFNPTKCNWCILGKQTRSAFPAVDHESAYPLDRVYVDHCGPITPTSYGNARYLLVFVDEATEYSWVYCVPDRSSSTTLKILKEWKPMVENQAGTTLKVLRTDNAKDFTGQDTITPFLRNSGVLHEKTTPYSSSSNGIAERMNRTLLNMVRPMLLRSKIPAIFWAEAALTANKTRNRLPTRALLNSISPHEAWFGTAPSISHFRQFGCIAFARIPAENIGKSNKLDPRSIQCCLFGYTGNRIYRLWDPVAKKIVTSRDVVFKEGEFFDPSVFSNTANSEATLETPFQRPPTYESTDLSSIFTNVVQRHPDPPQFRPTRPAPSQATPTTPSNTLAAAAPIPRIYTADFWDSDDSDDEIAPTPSPTPPPQSPISAHSSPSHSFPPSHHSTPSQSFTTPPQFTSPSHSSTLPPISIPPLVQEEDDGPRVSPRKREHSKKMKESLAGARVITTSHVPSFDPPHEPLSVQEALDSPRSSEWLTAMQAEIESLEKNHSWHIVRRPTNRKVIGTKFVFKLKNPETSSPRYKARLVAQGYNQVPGIDYTDTFAPVVKAPSIRFLLALAAHYRLHLHQFDVETAFLNPAIDQEIYVEQPPYFATRPPADYVLQLDKALYGLKQSPLLWANDLKNALLELSFQQSDADESIFILESPSSTIIVAVYVDDILALATSLEEIDFVHQQLSNRFAIRHLGPVKKFLGIDIHRPDPTGPITISQSTYARRLLHKYNMHNCNPAKTPFENQVQLHKRLETEEAFDPEQYRQIVGSLMHLAIISRPDLAYSVSKLAQFNSDPSVLHYRAAKHVLRYIQGTKDYAIHYSSSNTSSPSLHGYSDASYASDPDDRKSHSGYVFFLANGCISWSAHKQPVVALSTMESEYIALSDAAKEAVFLRKLARSVRFSISQPTVINTDSDSALDHVKNNVKHPRTKHIDIRHHYIRSVYLSDVDIQHVPAAAQTADVLTKPLGLTKHLEAVRLLNLFPNLSQRSRI